MKQLFFSFIFLIISNTYAFQDTAIVLIDMQDKFFERSNNQDTEEVKELVANNKTVLEWGVKNDLPILIFEYDGYGPTTDKLLDVYADHDHKTVIKYRDGGFARETDSRSEAIQFLVNRHVKNLIILGINGPYCVKSTVRGALAAGYEVYTASDIVADVNPHPPTFPDSDWWLTEEAFHSYENYVELIEFFEDKYSVESSAHLASADSNN